MADEETSTATEAAEAEEAQAAESDEAPATEPEAPAELTLAEAAGWAGFKLDEIGGASVGKVEGVYVDEGSGRPEWLQARMGRFGHHCLVPARDAVGVGGHVWVPYARDVIRKAPRIDQNAPLEKERELALLEHYGVGTTDVGRGAELAQLPQGAISARPA